MRHGKLLLISSLLVGALILLGWSRPTPAARVVGCSCASVQVAGRWAGTGKDTAGTGWTFTLKLKQRRCKLTGSFRWNADDGHRGTELVRGTVDCKRRFKVRGYQLKDLKGDLTTTRYRAVFSKDLRGIKGRWLDGIPGTFKGRKVK